MRTDHMNTLKRDLAVIADLAAVQEETKYITQIIAVNVPEQTQVVQTAKDLLQRLKGESLDIDQIYIWKVTSSGDYVYLADSENDENKTTDQGLSYLGPLPAQITRPVVTEIADRSFEIMAYAPLKDSAGKILGVAGFSVNGAAVAEDVQHLVIQVISVAALAILVVGIISWWLASNFARRLLLLDEAMDQMAAGNLEIILPDKGKDELSILASRLNQLAVSLSSEREEMLLSAIESLVAALEAKDSYTYGHSSQVSAMAYAIAAQIGLSEQDLFSVRIAALLHDIGKIGIPDQILNKPDKLDEEEFRIIRQHPEIGAKILSGIPALARVTEMVRCHHARWDGKGYPEGLTGKKIPLGARIIAVADTFQAMTSDRPYRKGMTKEMALAELLRCSDSQFDPVLVKAFCSIKNISGLENPKI
ncbi:MAG: HD domain-containing protein [Peptococcaceae bacterium]|nr:HD domain-containing protein [Peptococcaceae bacterium]